MTGYDHEPVIRRNSLNGGKVLKVAFRSSAGDMPMWVVINVPPTSP
jgi:hypothetical protein